MNFPNITGKTESAVGTERQSLLVLICLVVILGGLQVASAQERDQSTLNDQRPAAALQDDYTKDEIADALGLDEDIVLSASFGDSDKRGYEIFDETASGFPTDGEKYIALSSGCADLALEEDIDEDVISCELLDGPTGPGNATDIVQMEMELDVPFGANMMTFDFKFFSEEFPQFIDSQFNDGFVVEIGESSFTVDGSELEAPDNVVFDEEGNPITINDAGELGQDEAWAAGTAYGRDENGGATRLINTSVPISSGIGGGTITVIFTIFDVQDRIYDSTVFVDNIEFESQHLQVNGMELNQGVQNWDNDVVLVEDRPTILRAHMQNLSATESMRPNVWLEGYRDGEPLPNSPQTPMNSDPEAPPFINYDDDDNEEEIGERRGDFETSVNFQLPNSWLSGDVELKLAGGFLICPGDEPLEDYCEIEAEFEPTAVPEINFYDMEWTEENGQTHSFDESIDEHIDMLMPMLPVAELDYSINSVVIGVDEAPDDADVFGRMQLSRNWSTEYIGNPNRLSYGFVDSGSDDVAGAGRVRDIGGIMGFTNSHANRRTTTVHEFGHLFDRHHTADEDEWGTHPQFPDFKLGPCDSPADIDDAPDFPYFRDSPHWAESEISALGDPDGDQDEIIWGLDTWEQEVKGPLDLDGGDTRPNPALMSYCGHSDNNPRWISREGYEEMRNDINDRFDVQLKPALAERSLSQSGGAQRTASSSTAANQSMLQSSSATVVQDEEHEYLFINGRFYADDVSAEFQPFNKISATEDHINQIMPEPGDYVLQVLDEDENILEEVPFEPKFGVMEEEQASIAAFSIPVAYEEDIYETRIIEANMKGLTPGELTDDQVIGSATASPNPPEVSLEFPEGGEQFDDEEVALEWSGEDPDGEELTYTVLFSRDGGSTWSTIATGYTRTTLEVNTADLGGTDEGVIRVQASDGFNTADDVSGTFTIANTSPDTRIESPSYGAEIDTAATIPLKGSANDMEYGRLEGEQLQWSSDEDGHLGTGRAVDVPGSTLSPGTHEITLTATDPEGASGETSVTIEITTPTPQSKRSDAPEVVGSIPEQQFEPEGEVFEADLTQILIDPEGEELDFEAESSNEDVATVSVDNATLTVTPGYEGTAEISITGTNELEKSTTVSFSAVVGDPVFPELTAPVDDADSVSIPVTLSWEDVEDAEGYNLQIGMDPGFDSTVVTLDITDTSAEVSENIVDNTTYYWRIQAQLEPTNSGWSDVWSFTTLLRVPAKPEWVTEGTIEYEEQPEVEWEEAERAETYHLQVAETDDFEEIIIDEEEIEETEFKLSDLDDEVTYHARIRAENQTGVGEWSEMTSFEPVTAQLNEEIPDEFELEQNYPNPFNPDTQIGYELPEEGHVVLTIYDILGRQVEILVDETQRAGTYEVIFESGDLASGTYIYRLEVTQSDNADSFIETRSMMLIK